MKKATFLLIALFTCSLSYGQIRVITNGDVGVGTTTPVEQLDVNGNAHLRGQIILDAAGTNRIHGVGDDLRIQLLNNTNAITSRSYITMWGNNPTGNRDGEFTFASTYFKFLTDVQPGTLGSETMRLTDTGRLGIGAVNPTERLHVAGNIFVTGTFGPSDRRLKSNIVDFEGGLTEVLSLNPVSYSYNGKAGFDREKIHIGVVAQELQEVAPYLVSTFNHVEIDEDDNVVKEEEYLKIADSQVKWLLVNAVQDQQEIIDEQEVQIEALEERLDEMDRKMNQILEGLANNTTSPANTNSNNQLVELYGDKGGLQQNAPNPFNQTTVISYVIPERADNAAILIFDIDGSVLKTVQLNQKGAGQLTIRANELAPGAYVYNLVIDGQLIDTKKMVLTK